MATDLITKIKDTILRHTLLLIKRNMFYIENPSSKNHWNYRIVEAVYPKYRNMTHREWFRNIGVDISSVTRGYYYKGIIKIYDGNHHIIPKSNIKEKSACAYQYFTENGKKVKAVHLGGKPNMFSTLLGINWKPTEIIIFE